MRPHEAAAAQAALNCLTTTYVNARLSTLAKRALAQHGKGLVAHVLTLLTRTVHARIRVGVDLSKLADLDQDIIAAVEDFELSLPDPKLSVLHEEALPPDYGRTQRYEQYRSPREL